MLPRIHTGNAQMTETEGGTISLEAFMDLIKGLAWCKQEPDVLVAVDKATPPLIAMMKDHEVKVFPGGMNIKLNKSLLHEFQTKFDDGQPLPVVVVWKKEGVEIHYRRHKSNDFPYDGWMNPVAATYERERIFVPAEELGADFLSSHAEALSKAKACPSIIPPH